MVAPAGAGPWPQTTSTLSLPLRVSCRITGTSPPGPLRCGSTTCSVKAVATAASKALPPRSRMLMPTAVAIQWVEATTPKVPSISGRVVKGLGLMLPAIGTCARIWEAPPNHSLQAGPTLLRQKLCVSRPKRRRSRSESRDPGATDCGVGEFWPWVPGLAALARDTQDQLSVRWFSDHSGLAPENFTTL